MSVWKKMTINNSSQEDLDKYAQIQSDYHVIDPCNVADFRDKSLIPLLNGRKLDGNVYIYEVDGLKIIMAFKKIFSRDKYIIMHLAPKPFTMNNFLTIIDAVCDKMREFCLEKGITQLIGRQLLIKNYKNSIFFQSGLSEDSFISAITIRLGINGFLFTKTETEFEVELIE